MANGGHTSGDAVVGVTVAFTILAVISTCMRLYTRIFMSQMGGVDDFFIAASTFLVVALTVSMCLEVKYGMGQHQDNLTTHDNMWLNTWFWASLWLYYLSLFFAKMAILFQYRRIFPQPTFRKLNYALMVFITAYSCWTIFSAIFSCSPVSYFWMQGIDPEADGKCLNRLAVWFVNAGLNIFTDIAVTVLPLPVIKSLQLPKRPKLALMAVFCLGGVTCIVSLLRLQSLYAVSVSEDISWDNPMAALWSNLEVNIGILCACLPTLKTCIVRFFPRIFSSNRGTSSAGGVRTIGTAGYTRDSRKKKRDSIGMHFLGRGPKVAEVYEGRKAELETMGGTQIRPGSAQGSDSDKEDGIQVVTVVQQDSTPALRVDSGRSDTESTRKLVREFPA